MNLLSNLLLGFLISLTVYNTVEVLGKAAELPCDAAPNNTQIELDVAEYQSSTTDAGSVVMLQHCRWSAVSVTFVFSSPARLIIDDLWAVDGSIIMIVESNVSSDSIVEIRGTYARCISGAFSVLSDAVANFSMLLQDSIVFSEKSAVSIFANDISNVSIFIENSTVEVVQDPDSDHKGIARAASFSRKSGTSLVANGFTVSVWNSIISVSGPLDVAAVGALLSDAFAYSVSIQGLTIFVYNSDISVAGGHEAAAIGVVAACLAMMCEPLVNVSMVSMQAVQSNVLAVSQRASCSASIGVGVCGRATTCTVRELSALASDSTVSASSLKAAAAVGVAVCSDDKINLIVNDTDLFAERSIISSSVNNSGPAASIGVATRSANRFTTCSFARLTFGVVNSTITADAAVSAASLAIAVLGASETTVTVQDATILARNSVVNATGGRSVICLGLGTRNTLTRTSTITVSGVSIGAVLSNVTSIASSSVSAAVGFSSHGGSLITLSIEHTTMFASASSLMSQVNDEHCAAAMGISVAGYHNPTLKFNNLTIFGEKTSSTATTIRSVASSFAFVAQAWVGQHTVISGQRVVFYVSDCSLFAGSGPLKKVIGSGNFGIFALDSNIAGLAVTSEMELYSCDSTMKAYSAAGVKSSSPSTTARFIVFNTTVESDDACMNVNPAHRSAMRDVEIQCPLAGWNTSSEGALFYARDIDLKGSSCNETCMSTFFPGPYDTSGGEGILEQQCSTFVGRPVITITLPEVRWELRWRKSDDEKHYATKSISISRMDSSTDSSSRSMLPSQSSSAAALSLSSSLSDSASGSAALRTPKINTTADEKIRTSTDEPTINVENTTASNSSLPSSSTFAPLNVTNASEAAASSNPMVTPLAQILPSTAAETVATVGPISTIGSAVVTPTAASQYARVASVLRCTQCYLYEIEDVPSFLEHPFQFSVGSGAMPRYTGACISDWIVLLVAHALQGVLLLKVSRTAASKAMVTVVKFVGIATALLTAYFLPNVIGAASVLLFHKETSDAEMAVGIVAVILWAAVLAVPLLATLRLGSYVEWTVSAPNSGTIRVNFEPKTPSSVFVEALSKYFDDARDPAIIWCRLLFFEETISCSICAFLSGIRPPPDNCWKVLVSILIVSGTHWLYAALVRPFNRKLATLFSLASATIVVSLCIIGLIVLKDSTKQSYLAYPLLLQNSIFFLQAAVEGVWSFVVASKRKVKRLQAEAARALLGDDDDNDDNNLNGDDGNGRSIPMTQVHSNPLSHQGGTTVQSEY